MLILARRVNGVHVMLTTVASAVALHIDRYTGASEQPPSSCTELLAEYRAAVFISSLLFPQVEKVAAAVNEAVRRREAVEQVLPQ